MTYLPPINGGRINATIGGNTAGAGALVSTGTLTLAGGNNITLSQAGNAITISGANAGGGAAGTNTLGISNLGNSVGTSGVVTGSALQFALAGGNNVTLSQSINASSATITVSAANQSVQTQNVHNFTLAGNSTSAGAGYVQISSGTLTLAGGNNITLSQNGNAVTISAANGGGAGDGFNEALFSNSTANSTMDILWAGNTNGSGNVTMGLTGSTVTMSAPSGGGAAHTNDFYQNMDRGTSASLATANATLMLQRLNQENDKFAANITANTFLVNMTANMTATSLSSSHTVSASIGIYSDNNTNLSLINSATTSWTAGAATGNTSMYHGPRWLSFVSSQWSSAPVFSENAEYVFGIMFRSSNYGPPLSYIGQNYMLSAQRSGSIGTSLATNTSLAQGNYWNAMYSASTTAFPSVISSNQVNRNNATAIFMPHVILNNRYSGTF